MLSGLTIRQTMCFSTISVLKGVDDHCGYRLPWDPLQWLGEQDTRFHDVHHQSWGIKVCCPSLTQPLSRPPIHSQSHSVISRKDKKNSLTDTAPGTTQSNYSQLYTTFWDHVCGTVIDKSEREIEELYAKGRVMARERAKADG